MKRHLFLRHGFCDLPAGMVDSLQQSIRCHWSEIRDLSERFARSVGLHEIRIDWLLGDAHWGARVGELTYMGVFADRVGPVSARVAKAFAAGHVSHSALQMKACTKQLPS